LERIDAILLGAAAATGVGIILAFSIIFWHPFSDKERNNGALLNNSSAPAPSPISRIVTCKNNPINVDHPYQNVTVAITKYPSQLSGIHLVNLNSSKLAEYPDLERALMAEDKHYDEVIKYYENCKGYCPGPGLSEALSVNFCAGVAEPLVNDAVFQFNDQNGQNDEATGIWTTIVRVNDQIYDIIVYLGHG